MLTTPPLLRFLGPNFFRVLRPRSPFLVPMEVIFLQVDSKSRIGYNLVFLIKGRVFADFFYNESTLLKIVSHKFHTAFSSFFLLLSFSSFLSPPFFLLLSFSFSFPRFKVKSKCMSLPQILLNCVHEYRFKRVDWGVYSFPHFFFEYGLRFLFSSSAWAQGPDF